MEENKVELIQLNANDPPESPNIDFSEQRDELRRYLDNQNTPIPTDLLALARNTFAEEIDLENRHLSLNAWEHFKVILSCFQNLKVLNLLGTKLNAEATKVVSPAFAYLHSLIELHLEINAIGTGSHDLGLGLKHTKNLEVLVLYDNNISGIATLAESVYEMKNLVTLNLSMNPIGDSGAIELARNIRNHPSLNDVHLFNCGINDPGGEELFQAFWTMRNLSRVLLGGNLGISDKKIRKMKKKLGGVIHFGIERGNCSVF